jgi:hypothetical protein
VFRSGWRSRARCCLRPRARHRGENEGPSRLPTLAESKLSHSLSKHPATGTPNSWAATGDVNSIAVLVVGRDPLQIMCVPSLNPIVCQIPSLFSGHSFAALYEAARNTRHQKARIWFTLPDCPSSWPYLEVLRVSELGRARVLIKSQIKCRYDRVRGLRRNSSRQMPRAGQHPCLCLREESIEVE